MKRVFFSFHYDLDSWRASQIRNIGLIDGNRPASDNDWETIKRGGDAAIKKWINDQMKYRSCTIVLIGSKTANRKWINYEIDESWKKGMGVAGIHIHGLKNQEQKISIKGRNPFDFLTFQGDIKLSSIVRTYDPGGTSKGKYSWISIALPKIVEDAIARRKRYP